MMLRVIGKLGADGAHPMIEHFKFVAAHARATPKMTILRRRRCISATGGTRYQRRSIR
jgi:hypothetical protein